MSEPLPSYTVGGGEEAEAALQMVETVAVASRALRAHWGDPCRFCGTPHDEVEVGDCPGCVGEEVGEV